MGFSPDLIAVLAVIAGAGVFLVRRFTGSKPSPSCAPTGKAEPQVIVGSKLARAMAGKGTSRP